MRHFAALSCTLLLTGCYVGDLSKLRESSPEAGDFSSSLAAEYLAYADSEYELNHFISANYFAHKGLMAKQGKLVEPEPVDDLLPDDVKQPLTSSRELLMTLLTPDLERLAPQEAARTQLLFDCWAHQHGGGGQKAPCADEFQSAISELQEAAEITAPGKATSYTIAFTSKSATLGSHGQQLIKTITSHLTWRMKYRIELEGYSGPSEALKQLSEKQLAAVRTVLTSHGVAANRVHLPKADTGKAVYLKESGETQEKNTNQVKVTVVKFDSKAVADTQRQTPSEQAQ